MSLPEGYTRLEYIQSTGTQHIDTGFKPNQDTRVIVDTEKTAGDSGGWIFEALSGTEGQSKGVFWYGTPPQLNVDYGGPGYRYVFADIQTTERLLIDYSKNVITVNGKSNTFTPRTFQANVNLLLFACHMDIYIVGQYSGKLYSCQIYDNGTLIRNYIPCMTPSDEIGLYDDVNAQFYGNAGSGVFTAGPKMLPPNPVTDLQVINQTLTSVNLNWSPSSLATGYRVYRGEVKIADTQNLYYEDTGLSIGATYTYSVSAFNPYGESQKTKVQVTTSFKLVTDRTQADVDNLATLLRRNFSTWTQEEREWFKRANSKGAYNYTDLNRVIEAMDYLNDLFAGYGYNTGYKKIPVHPVYSVALSVDTSSVGTVWKFTVDKDTVYGPNDSILVTVYHEQWDSGIRYIHFNVSGAISEAVGGSGTISPALTPNNLQASFTINLTEIFEDVTLKITSVRG